MRPLSCGAQDAFPAWVARKGPRRRLLLVSLWLLNPVVVNVSSRGSADSIVALMVLSTVALVLRGTSYNKYTYIQHRSGCRLDRHWHPPPHLTFSLVCVPVPE